MSIDRGVAADFGAALPLCVRATDMTSGDDLGSTVAAAITEHLPDLAISCDQPGGRMVLTFQTSFSADTHSPRRGPRLGFSHLAMEQVGRGFYAEATMWDNSGGSNEELLERAVSVLSTFITSARALVPPNIQMQPTRRVSRVGARLIWRR